MAAVDEDQSGEGQAHEPEGAGLRRGCGDIQVSATIQTGGGVLKADVQGEGAERVNVRDGVVELLLTGIGVKAGVEGGAEGRQYDLVDHLRCGAGGDERAVRQYTDMVGAVGQTGIGTRRREIIRDYEVGIVLRESDLRKTEIVGSVAGKHDAKERGCAELLVEVSMRFCVAAPVCEIPIDQHIGRRYSGDGVESRGKRVDVSYVPSSTRDRRLGVTCVSSIAGGSERIRSQRDINRRNRVGAGDETK